MGQAIILNKGGSVFIDPVVYTKHYDSTDNTNFQNGDIEIIQLPNLNKKYIISCVCQLQALQYQSYNYIEQKVIIMDKGSLAEEYLINYIKSTDNSIEFLESGFINITRSNNTLNIFNFDNFPYYESWGGTKIKLGLQNCDINIYSFEGKEMQNIIRTSEQEE